MSKIFRSEELGLEVEIGKFARQADGAAWIKSGNNVVLCTAVASQEEKDFIGFFPLTVEYRERTSAAGKIPGGFFKREGKLTDFEVLSSRLIDRPIRPLFSPFYFNELQILATVYSSDGGFPTDVLALIGSSVALTISPIPYLGPVGAVRVGRVNGNWKFNAGVVDMQHSDVDLTVAGTINGICMVEGNCNNISEDDLVKILFESQKIIKKQIEWQLSIQKELDVRKREVAISRDWSAWKEKVRKALPEDFAVQLFMGTKEERSEARSKLKKALIASFESNIAAGEISKSELIFLKDMLLKETLPDVIAKQNKRLDSRSFEDIRDIKVEVAVLPRSHGSSFFQRGETQTLVSVTLGTTGDAQKMEPLIGETIEKHFMLHYNFPPFSTGEVKPIRGVGRRELGHGYLAETSFAHVLPKKEDFPYTIRIISDVLESNGSSSMATVCGTTMALMDSGVPLKDMISGIAMGLMKDSSGKLHVLSDILGIEDELGLMDFKVTGTATGIMAVQMDVKEKAGLSEDVLRRALEQARKGRLHILDIMKKTMTASRSEISELAPKVMSFKVPQDKIGLIIGPQGKNIKEIIATTGVDIDIDDDGTVNIYSKDASSANAAAAHIKIISGDVEIGASYVGKIKKHADFGMFVDIVPGKGGLIHISSIARDKQRDMVKNYPLESEINVKIVAYDKETGRIRLVAPELEDARRK